MLQLEPKGYVMFVAPSPRKSSYPQKPVLKKEYKSESRGVQERPKFAVSHLPSHQTKAFRMFGREHLANSIQARASRMSGRERLACLGESISPTYKRECLACLVRASRTTPNTWRQAPGAKHQAPSTTHYIGARRQAPSTSHHAPSSSISSRRQAPCTKQQAPSTRHQVLKIPHPEHL